MGDVVQVPYGRKINPPSRHEFSALSEAMRRLEKRIEDLEKANGEKPEAEKKPGRPKSATKEE